MNILKMIGIGVIQLAIGAIILFLINTVGTYIDVYIPINPITAAMTGLLGIPGLLALFCIKYLIL